MQQAEAKNAAATAPAMVAMDHLRDRGIVLIDALIVQPCTLADANVLGKLAQARSETTQIWTPARIDRLSVSLKG